MHCNAHKKCAIIKIANLKVDMRFFDLFSFFEKSLLLVNIRVTSF